MAGPMPDRWARPLRRLLPLWPYGLLAVLAGVTTVIKRADGGASAIDLGLCALAAVWICWMVTLHPGWGSRRALMSLFLAGLVVIMAILVMRDPWFGFLAPVGYFYAFRVLSWPGELAAITAVAVVAGTAQASGMPKNTAFDVLLYLAVLAINVVPMCLLAWLGETAERHNAQREKALAEVNEANRRLEASLAENAGLHERLLQQAREAGVVDERQRIAREIHDTLAQGLTGIITQLQAVEQAEHDPAGRSRHVSAAIALARESLSEARRSVHELRPQPLETARLSEALTEVAQRWSQLYGVAVAVTTTGTVRPLPPGAEVALLRTAQEALANVGKHAQASRVGVTLSYLEHEVALDVRDDGRGFTPGPPAGADGSFGLVAMRQRIEGLRGLLHIESEPDGGTAISARVPAEPMVVGA